MKICLGLIFILMSLGSTAQVLNNTDRYVISNEISINTTGLDFSPAYYRDGIVYVSTKVGEVRYRVKDERIKTNIMKLWQASRSLNGVLFEPRPFNKELSSLSHEGPVAFNADYTKIYFTRNEEAKSSRRSKKLKKLRIFTADLVGDTWENEQLVSFNDDVSNTAHPALSADGKTLVFSSDREGSLGGMDLWAVELKGDEWGKPYNLGKSINTEESEVFPTLNEDGTLYFSSKIYGGRGKDAHLDIFYSLKEGNTWSEKVSLSEPFNSPADDYGIIFDKDGLRGYFSSNREGGIGGDDIYSFSILGEKAKLKKLKLTLQVTDATTGEPIAGAIVKYLNTSDVSLSDAVNDGLVSGSTETGLTLNGGKRTLTDAKGLKTLTVDAGVYMVSVERDGYLSSQLPLILKDDDLSFPIALDPNDGCAKIRIVVLDENSLSPVAGVKVNFDAQGEVPDVYLSSDTQGEVNYCAPCNEIYGIFATTGGQRTNPAAFDTRGGLCARVNETTMTLYLRGIPVIGPNENPLVEGTVIQLPSVYYLFDQWQLSVNARNDLNHLASILTRYPAMKIELGSHTDSKGEASYNQQLSQLRANEAKRYLVEEASIEAKRITAVGYGEARLRNRCGDGVNCNEEEHRQNRRTEITISFLDNPIEISAELQAAANRAYANPQPVRVASTNSSSASGGNSNGTDNTRNPRRFAPSELTSGKYWVVAGSFQAFTNAKQRLIELEELGYTELQIVDFEEDGFNAVVVGKFTKLDEAAQFSRAIKEAHRIGAYVRKVE